VKKVRRKPVLIILTTIVILLAGGLLWITAQEIILMLRSGVRASFLIDIYINIIFLAIVVLLFLGLIFVIRHFKYVLSYIGIYELRGWLRIISILLILASLYPFLYVYDIIIGSNLSISEIVSRLWASPAFLISGIILYKIVYKEGENTSFSKK